MIFTIIAINTGLWVTLGIVSLVINERAFNYFRRYPQSQKLIDRIVLICAMFPLIGIPVGLSVRKFVRELQKFIAEQEQILAEMTTS